MRRLRPLLLIGLLLAASCGPGETPDRAAGGEIRVAVLSPALGLMLRELGLEDRIVGRHAWDTSLDASIPVVGDQSKIDYETLARAEPTHVLLQWGARPTPARLSELAASRGWTVERHEVLELDDIPRAVRALAASVGDEAARARADAMASRMDEAWRAHEGLAARAGRTLAVWSVRPVSAAGPGSFHFELLERLGIDAVPDDGAAHVTIDPEDLRRMDPDTVVLLVPGADAARVDDLVAPLERLGLRATERGAVVVIDHEFALWPGPSMLAVSEAIVERVRALPTLEAAVETGG